MFNLEQAIADWRQKMLAAGIEAPVPLEELELHLREEMERQVGKGMEAQQAFDEAVKSVGEAQPLKAEFKKVPEKLRNKFFRIANSRITNSLMYVYFALFVFNFGYGRLKAVHFKDAYSSGKFSSFDLLIGPIGNLYLGVWQLLSAVYFIWLAWHFFRHYPNLRVQKVRIANFKDQIRGVRRLFQIFCAMFVGWIGWLFCLHAVWQIDGTNFSFAFLGGSFSLENLFIGPFANLIMGTGSLALGGWLIGCAWKIFRSPQKPRETVLAHV
jgi:hypothetical protein